MIARRIPAPILILLIEGLLFASLVFPEGLAVYHQSVLVSDIFKPILSPGISSPGSLHRRSDRRSRSLCLEISFTRSISLNTHTCSIVLAINSCGRRSIGRCSCLSLNTLPLMHIQNVVECLVMVHTDFIWRCDVDANIASVFTDFLVDLAVLQAQLGLQFPYYLLCLQNCLCGRLDGGSALAWFFIRPEGLYIFGTHHANHYRPFDDLHLRLIKNLQTLLSRSSGSRQGLFLNHSWHRPLFLRSRPSSSNCKRSEYSSLKRL